MQEQKLYEYALIRLVPRPEREEFLNVGLILFSKKERYIQIRTFLCPDKSKCFVCESDYEDIQMHLTAFETIAKGGKEHPIAMMDIPERFRWLTAVKSSIIQTSRPHPGLTENLDESFERLYKELVL